MMGYIVAAVISSVADGSEVCFGLECWRWPFLIEVGLLLPLYVGFTLVPSEHITVPVGHKSSVTIGKDNELANGEEMSYEQNCSMDYPRGNWNKDKYSSPLRRTTLDRCLSANAADMNKVSLLRLMRSTMTC